MDTNHELETRLVDYAVRVIRLCAYLPKNQAGQHISQQFLRCGTAAAADYAEARTAESSQDIERTIKLILKHLNEARVWLHIIEKSGMLNPTQLAPIKTETEELCHTLGATLNAI